ncbi:MAG: dolichyl-phosphate beta-glucosyltransferase [Parcubacteria group bacterium]
MSSLREFPHSISVIIPTYNEVKRLPATLPAVYEYLTNNVRDFEILVVDDGSSDSTAAWARSFSATHAGIKVLPNKENRGKGAVAQQGLAAARGEYRLYLDADHSTNIRELAQLPRLVPTGAEVFIGSRYVAGSQIAIKQPWQRVLVSRIANALIRLLAVPGIHDTQNGFKIFSARAARAVLPYLHLRGWAFDIELLFVARRLGFKLYEFPITWKNDFGSKLSIARDIKKTGCEFAIFLFNRLRRRYPKKSR